MDVWYVWIVAGLVCGIFSALFGVGGGILMVPAMVLGLGLSQKSAQGMSLAIMIPLALAGAIRYKMNPEIEFDFRVVLFMALGGVVGALLGAHWVASLSGSTLRRVFALLMIAVAVRMFFAAEPSAPRATPPQGGSSASRATEAHANQSQ